jgi:hypothetical protein
MRWARYSRVSIAADGQMLLIDGTICLVDGPGEVVLTDAPLSRSMAKVKPPSPPHPRAKKRESRLLTREEFAQRQKQKGERHES